MVIKVFITSVSANSVLKKSQQTIIDTLTAKNIPFELIDISSPENEEQKAFMREIAKPKDGQANAMPPQLFSDDEYLGDYDAFYEATEDNDLDVFFKLATPTQKSEASVTITTLAESAQEEDASTEDNAADPPAAEEEKSVAEENSKVDAEEEESVPEDISNIDAEKKESVPDDNFKVDDDTL